MAHQVVEPRDVANLRVNDFALALFKPYPIRELEEFNRTYNEDLERPIETTMGGLIIQGRKRFEAARLRAYAQNKRREMLPCIVYPITNTKEVYRVTAERMMEDLDHPDAEDKALAQMCWRYGFEKLSRLDVFIREATKGLVSAHTLKLRVKLYGTPIVSYDTRRYAEDGLIEPAPFVRLIQQAEQEFGGGHGASVLPHRMPAARRRLHALVEAHMRGEKLPRTASQHATGQSARKATPEPSARKAQRIETDNLWVNILEGVTKHYLADLQVDPLLGPLHDERARDILQRLEKDIKDAVQPLARAARDKLRELRYQAEKQSSLSFNNGGPALTGYYAKMGFDPFPAETQPEEALNMLRQQYRGMMHKLHPDKGGDHEEATELNEAYTKLKDYWNSKRSVI